MTLERKKECAQIAIDVSRWSKDSACIAAGAAIREFLTALDVAKGVTRADDERLEQAAIRVWGEHVWGCDSADHMAELVLSLRHQLGRARAVVEAARTIRAKYIKLRGWDVEALERLDEALKRHDEGGKE